MEPQSTPDAPAPPPSKAALGSPRSWWGRCKVSLIPVVALILIAGLTPPRVIKGCSLRPSHNEAVNNARQIGLALSGFQKEYGEMPDESTVEQVSLKTGKDLKLKLKSSNEYFRQLLASGIAPNESMFYAQISGTCKPDNVFTGAAALVRGECGFTYLLGATKGCNPSRPLLVAPMIPGTDRFDPKPFDGKAVVLRMDLSASFFPIVLKTGHVKVGGLNLMDPANPIWEGKPPVIAWPEL